MAISPEGTFAHAFDVTDRIEGVCGRIIEDIRDNSARLVGYAPVLHVTEYQREPWQLYARLTLSASDRQKAVAASISFSVDRPLVRMLRPGDCLYLARTALGGLGISILRDDHLVAAAGAITHLPLGADVSVRTPHELVERAEGLFRARDPKRIRYSRCSSTRSL